MKRWRFVVHPSQADEFEWDDGNEQELGRHHIYQNDVEQVFDNEPTWASNRRGRAGAWIMVGRTDGGRVLTIVVTIANDGSSVRAITGWESTTGERTRYLRS